MVYYFEDESADVIGDILEIDRNEEFSLESISESQGISQDSLKAFFDILLSKNLISPIRPSKEQVITYRIAVAEWKKNKLSEDTTDLIDNIRNNDDAETLYMRKVGGITQAMFELTYNCSEKCIHCYNIGATRNNKEKSHRNVENGLKLEEYKKIIDQLYDGGCFRISLTGGDPFSNKYIWEIIEYIYTKGIAFDIYTNALGLVGNVEKLLSFYPRLMSISLYSENPTDHDFITRVPKSWEKTTSVMEELGKYAVPMDIKACIMRTNIKSYQGVRDIARKVGGVALFEASLNDSIDGDKCVSTYLRLTPEEYNIILRDKNIGLYVGKEVPMYGKQFHDPEKPICDGGRDAICIDPEGYVMPCTAFHLKLGNLRSQTIKEILDTPIMKAWLDSKLSDCKECLTHDYCDYCIICPGNSYSEHGDWRKASENNCYIAKNRYRVAQMLETGEDPLNGKTVAECLEALPEYKPTNIHRIKNKHS